MCSTALFFFLLSLYLKNKFCGLGRKTKKKKKKKPHPSLFSMIRISICPASFFLHFFFLIFSKKISLKIIKDKIASPRMINFDFISAGCSSPGNRSLCICQGVQCPCQRTQHCVSFLFSIKKNSVNYQSEQMMIKS